MSEGKWSTAFAAALNWAEIVCHCLLAPFGPSRILFLFYFLYFCCTSFGPVSGFLAAWLWAPGRWRGRGRGGKVTGKSGATVALECHLSKELPGNLHNYKRTCKRNAVSACPQFALQRFSALAFLRFPYALEVPVFKGLSARLFQFLSRLIRFAARGRRTLLTN